MQSISLLNSKKSIHWGEYLLILGPCTNAQAAFIPFNVPCPKLLQPAVSLHAGVPKKILEEAKLQAAVRDLDDKQTAAR